MAVHDLERAQVEERSTVGRGEQHPAVLLVPGWEERCLRCDGSVGPIPEAGDERSRDDLRTDDEATLVEDLCDAVDRTPRLH